MSLLWLGSAEASRASNLFLMGFPENIIVRFTEEEADYISMRPILRQSFTAEELVGMILTTSGKDPKRIREILHAGTLVYNVYRYWWERLDVEPEAVAEILSRFPDADPTRVFRPEECAAAVLESGGQPPRVATATWEVTREEASRKRLFRARSFWQCLVGLAQESRGAEPAYLEYSYARRADVYALSLAPKQIRVLALDAARLAARKLRARLRKLPETTRILFICPRSR